MFCFPMQNFFFNFGSVWWILFVVFSSFQRSILAFEWVHFFRKVRPGNGFLSIAYSSTMKTLWIPKWYFHILSSKLKLRFGVRFNREMFRPQKKIWPRHLCQSSNEFWSKNINNTTWLGWVFDQIIFKIKFKLLFLEKWRRWK